MIMEPGHLRVSSPFFPCWREFSYVVPLPFQVNLLFLINIVRIVVTKVQHQMNTNQTETAHIKKAVRATVILFPLLGITNFLFFFKPEGGIYEKLYLFFNAILKSSQVRRLWWFFHRKERNHYSKK